MMSRRVGAAAGAMLLLLTVSCGSKNTPQDAAPELEAALARVDDAVIAESYGQARAAVRDLKQLAIAARSSGELSDKQADEIVTAAVQLIQDLPHSVTPEPIESLSVSPAPTVEPTKSEKPDKEDKPPKDDKGPGKSEDSPGHDKDEG